MYTVDSILPPPEEPEEPPPAEPPPCQRSPRQRSIICFKVSEIASSSAAINASHGDMKSYMKCSEMPISSTDTTESDGDFDNLFTIVRPHIFDMICLSVEYKTFESCLEVNKSWRAILTYETFQRKARQNPY